LRWSLVAFCYWRSSDNSWTTTDSTSRHDSSQSVPAIKFD
jgi:hypothetical protein